MSELHLPEWKPRIVYAVTLPLLHLPTITMPPNHDKRDIAIVQVSHTLGTTPP